MVTINSLEMTSPASASATHRQVSLGLVLQQSENVLPCLNIVQNQLRPQIEESPGRCDAWRVDDGVVL